MKTKKIKFVIFFSLAIFLLGTFGTFQAEASQYDGTWKLESDERLHGWYFDVEGNKVYGRGSSDTGSVGPTGKFQYFSGWCHRPQYNSIFEGRLYSDGTGMGSWRCRDTNEFPSSGTWQAIRISGGGGGVEGDVGMIYATGAIMLVAAVGGLAYAVKKNRSGGAKHASSSRQSSGGVRIGGDTPKDLTGGDRPKHMGQPGWQGMIAKPITISDVSYALQDKMYRLKTMDLEKFFEDVGKCIMVADGALHTTELFARKAEKIAMEQLKKKVSKATGQPLADKILTYDVNLHEYRFKNVTEFAQTMAQFVRDELIDAAGDALPYAKILTVLVDNFGPEITAPYVCMYIKLQEI